MSGGAWQDRCSTVEGALNYMWENEIVVDIELKHESGRSLYAHKLVLALWSPEFAKLMTTQGSISKVKLEDDYEAMEIMLRYIYSSDVSNSLPKMPTEKLIKVFEIAERYSVVQLREKCLSSILRRKIDPYNVLEFFDFGVRKKRSQIQQKCLQVMKNKGIAVKQTKEDMSLVSLLGVLTQERIALTTEAHLLQLAITWLSYPTNFCQKSKLISFIDLSAIEWDEYQSILRDFPDFFSEKELASILLGVALCDSERFPEWYKPRVASCKHKCTSCTNVSKRINVLEYLNTYQISNTAETNTKVQYTFRIDYSQESFARLVQIELGFGPKNIPKNEFSVSCRIHDINRPGIVKQCFLDTIQRQNANNYVIPLNESSVIKNKDRLTLNFQFNKILKAYDIKAIRTGDRETKSASTNDSISVALITTSSLFIFAPHNEEANLLVSALTFRFCANHVEYLQRKVFSPKLMEPPLKKLKTKHYYPGYVSNVKKEAES